MHELERRALDDPFLADALEGFEHAPPDQEGNLAELTDRLRQRTEKTVRKMVPWVQLSAAASIIVVLGAGIWFFTNRNDKSEAKRMAAQDIAAEKKEVPKASSSTIAADTLKLKIEKENAIAQAPAL
jgi:hypothetical protein